MSKLPFPLLAIAAAGLAAVAALGPRARAPRAPGASPRGPRSATPAGPPGPERAGFYVPLARAKRRGDYRTALRMVDDALAGGYRRVGLRSSGQVDAELHQWRVELLARLGPGADAALVREATGLLRGRVGGLVWSPGPLELKPVLDAALRLGDAPAVDVIATRMDADSGWQMSDMPALAIDSLRLTPKGRLAYAYLTLAFDASGDMKYDEEVRLGEAAQGLEPNSVPVLARLADTYEDRRAPGDLDRAQAVLRRAYALLPATGNDRRDLRVAESDYGLDPAPPGTKTTLQQAITAWTLEGPARDAARRKRLEEGRARLLAERAAWGRSVLPGGAAPHF